MIDVIINDVWLLQSQHPLMCATPSFSGPHRQPAPNAEFEIPGARSVASNRPHPVDR